jgi:ABC-3C biological conflict system middle component
MKWADRPPEIAYLLNPAFCAVVLKESARAYRSKSRIGMPLMLTHLVLPAALHKYTRGVLPKSARTRLHTWLQQHPLVRLSFAERVRALGPYTRESLLFALQHDFLALTNDAHVSATRKRFPAYSPAEQTESRDCVDAAAALGTMFAMAGDPTTVMSLWGIAL